MYLDPNMDMRKIFLVGLLENGCSEDRKNFHVHLIPIVDNVFYDQEPRRSKQDSDHSPLNCTVQNYSTVTDFAKFLG